MSVNRHISVIFYLYKVQTACLLYIYFLGQYFVRGYISVCHVSSVTQNCAVVLKYLVTNFHHLGSRSQHSHNIWGRHNVFSSKETVVHTEDGLEM